MKRSGYFLIAASLFLNTFFAQIVPGYQGKRKIVSFQENLSPALSNVTYLNRALSLNDNGSSRGPIRSAFIPFNCTHSLSYEVVLDKKFSLCFMYSFAASKLYMGFTETASVPGSNTPQALTYNNVPFNCYGNYGTLAFTIYGKNALAPFGRYVKLNLSFCEMYASFVDKTVTNDDLSVNPYTLNGSNVYYGESTLGMGLTIGMNRILNNRVLISRGFSFNYLLNTGISSDPVFDIDYQLYQRLWYRDMFTFFISVGLLH